jgi:hypothetical protein
LLKELGITHPMLIVGFLLDLVNMLPVGWRRLISHGSAVGLGLDVKEENGKLLVGLVPHYTPLVETGERPSGLVVPGKGDAGLVLPR